MLDKLPAWLRHLVIVAAASIPWPQTSPTITAVANQSVAVSTATGALPFTIGDAELNTSILSVSSASSNTTLVPSANVVIGGFDAASAA